MGSVPVPRTANGIHAKLDSVARLVWGGHEPAPATSHSAGAGIWSAKLVIDRCDPRTRYAPTILGLELRRWRHHERNRTAFGRVIPAAVPALALAAEEVSLFDGIVIDPVPTEALAMVAMVQQARTMMVAEPALTAVVALAVAT